MTFAAGSRWMGLCRDGCQFVMIEGFLNTLGGGGADALVDRQCLPQVRGGLGGVAVVDVGVADSFEGASFLGRDADVAGDGQRLGMALAGLGGG